MYRYLRPASALLFPILFAQAMPATAPADDYSLPADEFFKRPEIQVRIRRKEVNIPLLEAAIFQQSNRERAANKLPPFKHGWALNLMARRHSEEMAELQFFDHESPTRANHTLADRLRNVGLGNVTGGENIAVLPAKEMGSGHYVIHENRDGTETWTDEATGKTIDYYTYAELAAAVLHQWMTSPAHRQNMMDPRFVYLGVGVARGPYSKGQDSFYMTQNFSDKIAPSSEAKASAQLQPSPPGASGPPGASATAASRPQ